MTGLTTELLGRACRIFLALAYPQGTDGLSPGRRCFASMAPDEPLARFVELPEVCEKLYTPEGGLRGLAFRLGSARFGHIKLQVIDPDNGGPCVFAVDTHDTGRWPLSPDEAEAWTRLQIENRKLKESIEREWERQGLLTFNALLRRGLEQTC
jgi:hypothetical protein